MLTRERRREIASHLAIRVGGKAVPSDDQEEGEQPVQIDPGWL